MDSMILGRYIPGDSIVHRLDPRSKLLAMMLLILIVFGLIILDESDSFYSDRDLYCLVRSISFIFYSGLEVYVFLDCLHNYFSTVFHF